MTDRERPAAALEEPMEEKLESLDLTVIRRQHALGYGQCHVDELIAEVERLRAALHSSEAPQEEWLPIETYPAIAGKSWFWIVPKTVEETYYDRSGRPILSTAKPSAQVLYFKGWGALHKATHWKPCVIPAGPREEKP